MWEPKIGELCLMPDPSDLPHMDEDDLENIYAPIAGTFRPLQRIDYTIPTYPYIFHYNDDELSFSLDELLTCNPCKPYGTSKPIK